MKTMSMSALWLRVRGSVARMSDDCNGIAATEFAVIVPMMLVMFLGTVEISSGIAVDRKVKLVARALADLTSQSSADMNDSFVTNVFTASIAILSPYSATPTQATLSEIYVDSNQIAKIQWSKAATIANGAATLATSSHNAGDVVTVPSKLLVKQTYLILGEVSYLYTPAVGYVMGKSGVTLSDASYTRPRQVVCVTYNTVPVGCPTP